MGRLTGFIASYGNVPSVLGLPAIAFYCLVEPAGASFEAGAVFGVPALPDAGAAVELGGVTELVP